MSTAAIVVYWYLIGLGWIGVGLSARRLIRHQPAQRNKRREDYGADETYGDELHTLKVQLHGEAQVPIVPGVLIAPSPLTPRVYGRARPRVEPRFVRTEAPHCTRTVVPVPPPPAWAARYQPGPTTREFNRIVGGEQWTQDSLDLSGVAS